MYRLRVISKESANHLLRENNCKLIRFYNGKGKFTKGRLMVAFELIIDTNIKYDYIFRRTDGMFLGEMSFCTPHRMSARKFNLTEREAISKLIALNEDNGMIWTMTKMNN